MRWRKANNKRRSAEARYRERVRIAKKKARIGLSYGMGIERLTASLRGLSVTTEDAREAVASVRRQYSRIRREWRRFGRVVQGG